MWRRLLVKKHTSQALECFSMKLLNSLMSPLEMTEGATIPNHREKMWVHYVPLRATTLTGLWKEFLANIQCSHVSTELLFQELMNDSIFESLIKDMREQCPSPAEKATQLTNDECNILRYACGYVAMKLHANEVSKAALQQSSRVR